MCVGDSLYRNIHLDNTKVVLRKWPFPAEKNQMCPIIFRTYTIGRPFLNAISFAKQGRVIC